mgnify:FL=1
MMSKRHYIAIAAEFRDVPRWAPQDCGLILQPLARRLADIFAGDNPAFDRDRFLHACGCPDEAS